MHVSRIRFSVAACGFPHTTPFLVLDNMTVQPHSSPAGALEGQLVVKTPQIEAFSLRR